MAETEQTVEEQLESLHANMKCILHRLAEVGFMGDLTDEQVAYVRTVYNGNPE
jgi:hypothetical protein